MANRLDPKEQNAHDKVISDIMHEQKFYPLGSRVIINPSSEHNKDVDENYPDIVCFDPVTNMTFLIGEVETEDSVNENEAQQWSRYAKLNTMFYLFVPDTCYLIALNLVKQYGIKADVHGYHYLNGVLITA